MNPVSKAYPLQQYRWGNDCDGWNFVNDSSMTVKQERMPAGASETLHYHQHAQQFFFILDGEASFEIEDRIIIVKEQEGIHIRAGQKHRIINHTESAIEFILSSQPSTENDRINL
jgi:mannose-6-phosphate isomerase-like protein (cupin superfamily)